MLGNRLLEFLLVASGGKLGHRRISERLIRRKTRFSEQGTLPHTLLAMKLPLGRRWSERSGEHMPRERPGRFLVDGQEHFDLALVRLDLEARLLDGGQTRRDFDSVFEITQADTFRPARNLVCRPGVGGHHRGPRILTLLRARRKTEFCKDSNGIYR